MIPVAEPFLGEKEAEYVNDAVKSTWISSGGKYIKEFEEKFAEFCEVKHAISCNNGTSALHLALLALGIKEGDEVIIPTLTYIATANVLKYVGAKPVFVDSDRKSWNIDVNKIEEKITERTKAIIPVHLYGLPCDMDKIIEIARRHNLYVIEDCAEAHGARYKGKKVGCFGDIGCFSFFGNKIITTGEGGMCITNNEDLKDKMELFKNQGMSKEKRYFHPVVGYNYRMTNIQAAIGLAQLEKIEEIMRIKKLIASLYKALLTGVEDIEVFQEHDMNYENVYWMCCILSNKRDELMKALKEADIETRPFFVPVHKMPPYENGEVHEVAEGLGKVGINLPSSPNLKEEDIRKICEIIRRVHGKTNFS